MRARRAGRGRGLLLYGLACVVLIALTGAVFALLYDSAGERRAVMASAAVALVVQLLAFALARLLAEEGHGIAGWGLGAAICIVALVIYGFAGRALGLAPNAALLSLATFFFVTELIEPPLLTV